jgi:hypothetical protein
MSGSGKRLFDPGPAMDSGTGMSSRCRWRQGFVVRSRPAGESRVFSRKENMVRKRILLMLLILVLGSIAGVVFVHPTPAAEARSCATVAGQAGPAPATDLAEGPQTRDLTPVSGCGANFCTQAQKTQCAQSCKRHPFVGLECCTDTCTSFCNCGSVPTGC